MTCRRLVITLAGLMSLPFLCSRVWAQADVLKGRIVDDSTGQGIPYVSVWIGDPENKSKATITEKDGSYKISGPAVEVGTVILFYSKQGYTPRPGKNDSCTFPQGTTDCDGRLLQDTSVQSYYHGWASRVTSSIGSQAKTIHEHDELIEKRWEEESEAGMSIEGQAASAREIASMAKVDSKNAPRLTMYAAVDPDKLHQATVEIQAAIQNPQKAALSSTAAVAVPSEVATDIAKDELRKQSPTQEQRERFIKKFAAAYGQVAADEVAVAPETRMSPISKSMAKPQAKKAEEKKEEATRTKEKKTKEKKTKNTKEKKTRETRKTKEEDKGES